MILNIFCFFDRISQSFIPQLMLMPSKEVFLRGAKHLINNPNFPHKDIVDDLEIYLLGDIDLENGIINSHKEFICNAIDFTLVKSEVKSDK